ncbi:phage tail protein [Shewanella xiamenensis]|uniref:phage tail-collar fiber domain-containing protein n=1 Tax=Shewanella xiamenensis TaxID=332186 RepID=UPI00313D359F
MASVITIAGEQLFAAKAQANEQLDIDTFIFANVPNQDHNAPINREEGIPTAHIVYQQNVQQVGRINDNVVVYSTVLDSITGPFEFNWVGLYSSVNQKLVAINHVPTVTKTATAPGAAGNTLNRNFGIEYSGIAELTGISVEPETWQLDFTARLSGMDKLTQQLATDMNGKDWFIDDGLKVVPRTTVNTFSVTPGVGYVSGLRVELKQEHILIVQSYPQFVYVDAWFSGNANSTWSPQLAFTVTNTEMDDYIDPSGTQHYVYKLAVINAADNVDDLRIGSDYKTNILQWKNKGDIRGWGASILNTPALNKLLIQKALDESLYVFVPKLESSFKIDGRIFLNNNQVLDGDGEIENVKVFGVDTNDYKDALVIWSKPSEKVGIDIYNFSSFGTRYEFIDYKAGMYIKIPFLNNNRFNVGEFVIVESIYLDGDQQLPRYSFVTKIVDIGDDYISFFHGHSEDIGVSTIRSLKDYDVCENITVKNLTLKSSFYVGDGQFGGCGGLEGFGHKFDNVKFIGGIGLSMNFIHHSIIERCDFYNEYVSIEKALLSSNNIIRNNRIIQKTGFAAQAFGKNGNRSSAGIMMAEGNSGSYIYDNEIMGNWFMGIWYKSHVTPSETKNNKIFGEMYSGVMYNGNHVNVRFEGQNIKLIGNETYGVFAEEGSTITTNANNIKVENVGIVLKKAKLNKGNDEILAETSVRLEMNDKVNERTEHYIKAGYESEIIKDFFFTSGGDSDLNDTDGVDIFYQDLNSYDICEKGVAYEMEGHINFLSNIERLITLKIGSSLVDFIVHGAIIHIDCNIINTIDDGAIGYGLGAVKVVSDGLVMQKVISIYPGPLWGSKEVKVNVKGVGKVSSRYFSSKFRNNFCKLYW